MGNPWGYISTKKCMIHWAKVLCDIQYRYIVESKTKRKKIKLMKQYMKYVNSLNSYLN